MDDDPDGYLALNRENWDQRAPAHAASRSYAVDRFVSDPEFLSDVVRFDRERLGDLAGIRAVHLQCHIGTDTLSLARLGARMTGLDFSPASLAEARALAARTDTPIEYVESDVYAALAALPRASFDLVYTGIGAIGWLPSIERWARVVAGLLRPGGRLFVREGHPVLWSFDEEQRDRLEMRYSYFERAEPLVFSSDSTYVETDVPLEVTTTHEWNHGLGETVTALLDAGLTLTALIEHDSAPWEALPGQMVLGDDGEWRLDHDRWRAPLTYTLQAELR